MSKMYELNEEQIKLRNELYFIKDSDEEEDIERTNEINERIKFICKSGERTVSFLYPIWREAQMRDAGDEARVEWIKKGPLKEAIARTKKNKSVIAGLERAILFNIENFDLHDVNLKDGSTINKKLNPGRLVINEQALDLDVLPESLTRTIPEHKELLPPDKERDYPGAAALIKQELMDSIKDEKGRLDQSTSFVTLDKYPGISVERKTVIQIK